MAYKDPEKQKAWRKAYYAAHAEEARKNALDWYYAHRDDPAVKATRKAQGAQWRANNREKHLAARRRRWALKKEDPEKWAREQEANLRRWRTRTEAIRVIVDAAKESGCLHCGETDPGCLDFHHRDPEAKLFDIGKAIQRSVKHDLLRAELAKCDVVCANCHQIHHPQIYVTYGDPRRVETGRKMRAKREAKWGPLIARAMAAGCTLCDHVDTRCLEFHHVDPATKSFMVGMYPVMKLDAPIYEEIHKCMVLCANCHRRVHKGLLALPDTPLDAYWSARLF